MRQSFIRLFYVDNTTLNAGTGGDVIASDDIAGVKHQRVKVEFGADGSATDASAATPFPAYDPDITITGNITATDAVVAAPAGNGDLVTGTPTANSYVAIAVQGGDSTWLVSISGTTISGKYYFEISLDATSAITGNWTSVNARETGVIDTKINFYAEEQGIFRTNAAGAAWVRVRNIGGTSPNTTVTMRLTSGVSGVAVNTALPAGNNLIGRVGTIPLAPDINKLKFEGTELDAQTSSATTTKIASGVTMANSLLNFSAIGQGRATYVESIVITTRGGAPFNATGWIETLAANPSFRGPMDRLWVREFGPDPCQQVLPVNRIFPEGSCFTFGLTSTGAGKQQRYTIEVNGFSFTDDFNFSAKTVALVIGTSLEYDNQGIDPATGLNYSNKWLYLHQWRSLMYQNKKSVRLINKAVSGTTSADWLTFLQRGDINGIDYDLLVVSLGVNDSTGSVSTANFELNLKEFIKHRDENRPNASIIFMAPPVTDSAARSAIASYRTSVNTVATDATLGGTARNVYFYDASTAFSLNATATADTNFSSLERSAGNRVHPSGAGNTLIAAGLFTVTQTTDYYKNKA